MKFLTYINEANIIDWDPLIVDIKQKCKPFLNKCNPSLFSCDPKLILWRGAKKLISDYRVVTTRQDRQPMDTPKKIHDAMDEVFFKNFGWRPRSEGAFATTDKDTAGYYGGPFIFLPIGEFKFIWSWKVTDLYNALDLTKLSKLTKLGDEELKIFAEEFIKKNKYRDTDLVNAMSNGVEIMFKCQSYYLIRNQFEKHYKRLFR